MRTLKNVFEDKNARVLSIYLTAGYPELGSTVNLVNELDESGVDFIELGIPFSDPMADGKVIQESSATALQNGMNMNVLTNQIVQIRSKTDLPIVLMGYFNPVYQFGIERLLKFCQLNHIEALIIPDISPEYYKRFYQSLFEAYGVSLIFMITADTCPDRLREIDKLSNCFIYLVSSPSITGQRAELDVSWLVQMKKITTLNLKTPVVVGFGIQDKESFAKANDLFDGAIIGSAFIKHIGVEGSTVSSFVNQIKAE